MVNNMFPFDTMYNAHNWIYSIGKIYDIGVTAVGYYGLRSYRERTARNQGNDAWLPTCSLANA